MRDRTASRFGLRDLIAEAAAGISARPGRTLLTATGVMLGVGALVAVLGLTATAAAQISDRFNALTATEVTVKPATSDADAQIDPFPEDTEMLASRVTGVKAAGRIWEIDSAAVGGVSNLPVGGVARSNIQVFAVTPGLFGAVHATTGRGRLLDLAVDGMPVAVLGESAARQLGVSDELEGRPVVFVGTTPITIIGIVADVERSPSILSSVVITSGTAVALWGQGVLQLSDQHMIVDTRLGAAAVVADQLALALRPDDPTALVVSRPPDPHSLRDGVSTDFSRLLVLLAVVCLTVGMVGIANTTLVSVLERVPEIGLRRALGAKRRHVVAQFLLESSLIGLFGGLVGSVLGVVSILGVSAYADWTPVLEIRAAFLAPALGAAVGLAAGGYPAVRAGLITPISALRT